MKPMPDLDALLARAAKLGVFGTKMRSVINLASKDGIAAIVKQQFEIGDQIAKHGLIPILEPEVSIKSPDKAGAEAILLAEMTKRLDALPERPPGDAQADDPEHAGSLRAADQAQASRCASSRCPAAIRGPRRAGAWRKITA